MLAEQTKSRDSYFRGFCGSGKRLSLNGTVGSFLFTGTNYLPYTRPERNTRESAPRFRTGT
jgi:hypothetical protein